MYRFLFYLPANKRFINAIPVPLQKQRRSKESCIASSPACALLTAEYCLSSDNENAFINAAAISTCRAEWKDWPSMHDRALAREKVIVFRLYPAIGNLFVSLSQLMAVRIVNRWRVRPISFSKHYRRNSVSRASYFRESRLHSTVSFKVRFRHRFEKHRRIHAFEVIFNRPQSPFLWYKIARFLGGGIALDWEQFPGFRQAFEPADISWDVDTTPLRQKAIDIEQGKIEE